MTADNDFKVVVNDELKSKCKFAEYFALQYDLKLTLETKLWKDYENMEENKEKLSQVAEERESDAWVIRSTPRIQEFYEFKEKITKGEESRNDIVRHKTTEKSYACRTIYKNCVPFEKRPELFNLILEEIALLYVARDFPQTVDLFEVFENEDSVMLITTWCPRGELESFLLSDSRPVTEKDIQRLFSDILEVIQPYHQIGISHGDIKAEKILLKGDIANYMAREYENEYCFSDYSMVKQLYRRNAPFSNTFQDYFFFAPESYSDNIYTRESDVWALVVILFIMKYGYPPFMSYSENKKVFEKEMEKYIRGGFVMTAEYEGRGPWIRSNLYTSVALKDLFKKLFCHDIIKRNSIDEIMDHPWMLQFADTTQLRLSLAHGLIKFADAPEYVRRCLLAMFEQQKLFDPEIFPIFKNVYNRIDADETGNTAEMLKVTEFRELIQLVEPEIEEDRFSSIVKIFQGTRPPAADIPMQELMIVKYLTTCRLEMYKLLEKCQHKDTLNKGALTKDTFRKIMKKNMGETNMQQFDTDELFMQFADFDDNGTVLINYREVCQGFINLTKKHEINYSMDSDKYLIKMKMADYQKMLKNTEDETVNEQTEDED